MDRIAKTTDKYDHLSKLIIFSLIFALLLGYLILQTNKKIIHDQFDLAPMLLEKTEAKEMEKVEFEQWTNRFFQEISHMRYMEIKLMHHPMEVYRINQHQRFSEKYLHLLQKMNKLRVPEEYGLLYHTMKEEVLFAYLMHSHYLRSYPLFKQYHFEKTKKHYQGILIMEKNFPKFLYRWLIHEKSNFQTNVQGKSQ